MEANDVPMKDVVEDVPTPLSSSGHADLTIGEDHVQYTEMLQEEEEAKFRHVQADRAYNLGLLEEHRCVKEQLSTGTSVGAAILPVVPDVDVPKQELLLDS
ncbi:U-box domain-containing protein 9 [Hordeum vulgare]|nr:U-box domain-containing protein 9 [Hordeum vulgare]